MSLGPWIYTDALQESLALGSPIAEEFGSSVWKMKYFEAERQAQSRIEVRLYKLLSYKAISYKEQELLVLLCAALELLYILSNT